MIIIKIKYYPIPTTQCYIPKAQREWLAFFVLQRRSAIVGGRQKPCASWEKLQNTEMGQKDNLSMLPQPFIVV